MAKAPSLIISHWFNLIENFNTSPLKFYSSVEAAINSRQIPFTETSRVEWHEGGTFSVEREYLRITRDDHIFDICAAPYGTGFFVSWWLGQRKTVGLLMAAAIFGGLLLGLGIAFSIVSFIFTKILGAVAGGFLSILAIPFIIWLLGILISEKGGMIEDAILQIPIVGYVYSKLFNPITYYKIDTATMFQEAVRLSINEVIDAMTKEKGIRGLSELERKPMMRDFYQKQIA